MARNLSLVHIFTFQNSASGKVQKEKKGNVEEMWENLLILYVTRSFQYS